MSIRAVVVLAAALCAAPLAVSAAQQAPDSARVAVSASSASVSSPSALPGPRLSPQFQRAEPTLGSSFAAASGQHTIVISTLVLVLAVIIIVLLVAK